MGGRGEVGNEREREERKRVKEGREGERERKDVKMEGKEKCVIEIHKELNTPYTHTSTL